MKYNNTQFKRLEPGEHLAQIAQISAGMSMRGVETLEVVLTIDGAKVNDTLYNSERGGWRIGQFRAAFGHADPEGDVEFDPESMFGQLGRVRLDFGEPRTSGKHIGKRFLEVKEYLSQRAQSVDDGDEIVF
jgi:hypothetical protein